MWIKLDKLWFVTDDEGTIKDAFLPLKETSFEDACREYQHRCLFLLLGVRPAVTGINLFVY